MLHPFGDLDKSVETGSQSSFAPIYALSTAGNRIIGSAYEFSHFKGKYFAPLFHPKARFTDDTVCTVAVADALVRGADPQTTMIDWCRRFAENGGWGKQFAEWFMDDNPQPYGSWGNGAAMRIAPVGLLASTEAEVLGWSDTVTAITHNHPDALNTAHAVAMAIFWAQQKTSAQDIGQRLSELYGYQPREPSVLVLVKCCRRCPKLQPFKK